VTTFRISETLPVWPRIRFLSKYDERLHFPSAVAPFASMESRRIERGHRCGDEFLA